MDNFCKQVLEAGGQIVPILLDFEQTNGTGIFNPSVYYDTAIDKLLINIRHCQYILYHSEKNIFESQWGPLSYLNPENDMTLTTTNYICELDPKLLEVQLVSRVDTSQLDVKPIWEFVGLEDVRLARWEGRLYATGVRRDTTPNGQGRMELSELDYASTKTTKEVSRYRIPSTGPDNTYCEKNWMPIVEKPFHYVKWCNPTEVVYVNRQDKITTTIHMGTQFSYPRDFRGGSQVIRLNDDYSFACVHTVYLFKSEIGAKNAIYRHCFIIWDKEWNVYKVTPEFSFLNGMIEFCTGMTKYKDDFILSFGFQDNACYLLRIPQSFMENLCLK